jgi:hypothetical protein
LRPARGVLSGTAMHALLLALVAAAPPLAASPTDVPRLLGRLASGEPRIEEVQAAAAAEATRDLPEPGGAGARRRWAALLPRLTAEVRHDESGYRVVGLQGSGEVDYARYSPGTTVALRATWELSGLVAPRTPDGAAAALARARHRDEAVRRATTLYFERRRRLLALLAAPPADPVARAEAELELDRLAAELDALTGGLYAGGRR